MFASFSTALSALDANSTAVDVVGNNLANLNTSGYKENAAYFHDLISTSMGTATTQLGFGVAQPMTLRQFSQGAVNASGGNLDAAIQGDGFFMLRAGSATEFTRAGSFQVDLSGNLLTPTGEHVQGWTAQNGLVNTGGAIGDIVLPVGSMQVPQATQNITLDGNLNAAAAADATSNWSTTIQAYDSLGNSHVLTLDFQKTGANNWQYTVTVPASDLQAGGTTQLATGNLIFAQDGTLDPAQNASPITFDLTNLADGAKDMKGISWSLYNPDGSGRITQYQASSAQSANSQDGRAASQLTAVTMADGGQVIASYSNGQKAVVAQLAIASIRNPESLVAVGNNNYEVTANTAAPSAGAPGTGGRGNVVGQALEASNVDIAKEFTHLIVLQSSYQANAKVVTTVNQMTQATSNLIT
jgi:flagellar hook protein FlgE